MDYLFLLGLDYPGLVCTVKTVVGSGEVDGRTDWSFSPSQRLIWVAG
jgi:hypothetical protein